MPRFFNLKVNNMKKLLLIALGLNSLINSVASAETTVPTFKEGDKWIYSVTEAKNTNGLMSSTSRKWENVITRAGSHTISVSVKTTDSNLPPKELSRNVDWSATSSMNGESTVTSKPYDFPLKENKTWKIEYFNSNVDAKVKSEKITKQYTVIGWEDITVPAGTFHAIKVEMEGDWHIDYAPVGATAVSAVTSNQSGSTGVVKTQNAGTPKPVTGKLYAPFWYVPEIKTHVKVIDEDYQAGGALNKRVVEELESFTPAAH